MDLNSIILYIFVSSIFSLVISFPVINILYKFKIVRLIDKDFAAIIDSRRLKMGIPIMGGLIVVFTVLIINLFFNLNGTTKIPLLVFTFSAILGAFDDILNIYGKERKIRSVGRTICLIKVHANPFMRLFYLVTLPWAVFRWVFYLLGSNPGRGIQSHEKIIVQTIIGALVSWWIYFGSGWENPGNIWFPWIGNIDIGVFMIPFIILTIIGTANAVNFTDGMDGLAAGLLLSAFFGFLVVAYTLGNASMTILTATVIGSLITYLYFNIPPARFQMGDVGSLALGTLLAVVAFALNRVVLLPILGLFFVIETLSTIIQGVARRLLGRRIFKMAPIHHHFEMLGWPEHKIVMRFWILSPILILFGIWLSQF